MRINYYFNYSKRSGKNWKLRIRYRGITFEFGSYLRKIKNKKI